MSVSFIRLAASAFLAAGLLMGRPAAAQTAGNASAPPAGAYTYQLVTTIESVVPGGFGRSKLSYTPAYKGVKEAPMEGLFSLTGLNMGNLQKNEETIMAVVQQMTGDGYELVEALPLTSSIQGSGIFMTRYLFRKAK